MPSRAHSSDDPSHRGELGLGGRAFRLLLAATVACFSGFVLLLPLVPLWAIRGDAGEFGAGATTSVFMLATVLTQLAMPWLLERGGYRWTFPLGALLLGLPAPFYALTTDLGVLLALSGVRGVGFGMVSVTGAALAARLVPREQIGRAAGYYGLAAGLPHLVFLATGVWLALHFGFVVTFWIAGVGPVLGAVAAVGIRLSAGESRSAAPTDSDPAATRTGAAVLGGSAMAGPLLLMLVAAVASSAIVTFLAIPLQHASWVAVLALLGYGAMLITARWTAGVLSDRHGRAVLLVPGMVGAGVGMTLAAWAVHPAHAGWTGPGTAGAILVVAGAALFGAGFGAVQNDTLVVMFRRAGPAGYGTASAVWNVGYDSGTGIGALALGAVLRHLGYGWGFAITAAAVAACLPVALALGRNRNGAAGGTRCVRTRTRARGRNGSG